jgi:hypothetical protein
MAVFKDFEVAGGEVMHGILLSVGDSNIHDDKVGAGVNGGCGRSGVRLGRGKHGKRWQQKGESQKIKTRHEQHPFGSAMIPLPSVSFLGTAVMADPHQ